MHIPMAQQVPDRPELRTTLTHEQNNYKAILYNKYVSCPPPGLSLYRLGIFFYSKDFPPTIFLIISIYYRQN